MSNRRTFIVLWDGRGLVPVNASEFEAMDQRLALKETVVVAISKQRSSEQLAYYWAKLKELLDSGALPRHYYDVESIHDVLKMEMGFVRPVVNMRGHLEFHPKSIAMDKLGQDAMNQFMERAWALIAEHWGVDMEAIGAGLSSNTQETQPASTAGRI